LCDQARQTLTELAKLRQWEIEYNHRRPHLALGERTSAERLCELRIAADPVLTRSLNITA
jgi:hypothetical protein